MSYINDLSINISLQTKPISSQGFGLPLIVGSRAAADDLCKEYGEFSEAADMITAGFEAADPEYKMAGLMFGQSPRPDKIAVYVRDTADAIGDSLSELLTGYNDWYGFLITERDNVTVNAAGDWALANEKLFIGCALASSALTDRNNIREAYLIHDDAANFPEAAWAGLCLPQEIGSITWKWKTPTGAKASGFTPAQLQEIRDKNGQTLSKRSGVIYSDEGITTGGEYIDVIMSRDYVKARLSENLFAMNIRLPKISMDNSGMSLIESALREVFNECGERGIIAKAESEEDKAKSDEGVYMYKVNVPLRHEIPVNDRAARKVPGITFSFTIAGAVHSYDIDGVITA